MAPVPRLAVSPAVTSRVAVPVRREAIGCDATPGTDAAFPHYCPLCMMSFRRAFTSTCCRQTLCEVCARELMDAAATSSPLRRALARHDVKRPASSAAAMGFDVGGRLSDDRVDPGVLCPVTAVTCPYCSGPMRLRAVQQGDLSAPPPQAPGMSPYRSPYRHVSELPGCVVADEPGTVSPVPFALEQQNSAASPSVTPVAKRGAYSSTAALSGCRGSGACGPSPVRAGDGFAELRRKLRGFDNGPLPPLAPLSARGQAKHKATAEEESRPQSSNPFLFPGVESRPRWVAEAGAAQLAVAEGRVGDADGGTGVAGLPPVAVHSKPRAGVRQVRRVVSKLRNGDLPSRPTSKPPSRGASPVPRIKSPSRCVVM